jgi:hypothetical protein
MPVYQKSFFSYPVIITILASVLIGVIVLMRSNETNAIKQCSENATAVIAEIQKDVTKHATCILNQIKNETYEILEEERKYILQRVDTLTTYLTAQIESGFSKGRIGWLFNTTHVKSLGLTISPTMNISQIFVDTLDRIKVQGIKYELPKKAFKYKYVLLSGLFTRYYPGYFVRNLAHMKDLGLDVRAIFVNDTCVETAARQLYDHVMSIIDELKDPYKKIVLIGHSKGAIDGIALLSIFPELKKYIKVLIAVQPPFGGTAFATDLINNPGGRKLLETMVMFMTGDISAVEAMGYDERQKFLLKYPFHACSSGCKKQVCDGTPTISFTTASSSMLSVMASVVEYVKVRYHEQCDGLVTTKDGIIPGNFMT